MRTNMQPELVHADCRYFRGHIPCEPHKRLGVHCNGCPEYESQDIHVLVIKLGAIGDVIRTTPILSAIKREHPHARIYWLTNFPSVLPSLVDVPLQFSLQDMTYLRAMSFDLLLNLDKDREACALASQIVARTKKGFGLSGGKAVPFDAAAQKKYLTGVFDDINKANKLSYVQEIFEICGFHYAGEEYVLNLPVNQDSQQWEIDHSKTVIGLNTGCGERWPSRLWGDERWVELAKTLLKRGFEVVILGGKAEHEKNLSIASASGTRYFGHFPLTSFMHLVNECDILVTAVTMALHVGIAFRKKIVLLNNIFNRHEFELYGRGVIVEPQRECKCFFLPNCTNREYFCMNHLATGDVMSGLEMLLKQPS